MSYEELDKASNKLAHYLLEKHSIVKGSFVGVKQERDLNLLVSLLGVLKAGACYVPIDISYPADRIEFMEQDSGAVVVLDAAMLADFNACATNYKDDVSPVSLSSNDLAYIIYTSGSTGAPKGVQISHGNMMSLLNWSISEFKDTPFKIMYGVTSHCFDLSVYEFFYPLVIGRQLRILGSSLEIGDYLLLDEGVLINTVPSVIQQLVDTEDAEKYLSHVAGINMAGEVLPIGLVKKFSGSSIELRNLYGPSEDTTYSSCYRIDLTKKYSNSIPIGKPLSNTFAYILDTYGQLVPRGVIGELCLGGSGVSPGYLNRDELTKEKFVANPFRAGELMYKTGDLCRYLEDGVLEFIGRIDDQVKLRGYRIELGEIAYQIECYDGISQALVLVQGMGSDSYLVCYYVGEKDIDSEELRTYLMGQLPDYMVPGVYVAMESFPLTSNGKIDRRSLPAAKRGEGLTYVEPSSDLEVQMVSLWSEVLQLEASEISVTSSFFDLGGHSLSAISLSHKIIKHFNSEISIRDIFMNPTIKMLVELIENATWLDEETFELNDEDDSIEITI